MPSDQKPQTKEGVAVKKLRIIVLEDDSGALARALKNAGMEIVTLRSNERIMDIRIPTERICRKLRGPKRRREDEGKRRRGKGWFE